MISMEREKGVDELMLAYLPRRKNASPLLMSLLYDADMMPEQIISMRGAISFAAVIEAYELGFEMGQKSLAENKQQQ